MASTDPITGQKLPLDAVQRVLFVAPKVFVYAIPPLNSTRGFNAASWTANPKSQIFTARVRILETAIPTPSSPSAEKVLAHVLLEDSSTGQLFAGCPYTSQASVEQALDSSRFFAVRVVGEGGMKATLGVGFEERSDAFDFNVSLQDVRRSLGLEGPPPGARAPAKKPVEEPKQDFSLKEGQTITVNIGGKGRRGASPAAASSASSGSQSAALFSIKPPPPPGAGDGGGGTGAFSLAPPPSAADVKAQQAKLAQESGFDDGEFGEFQ